MRTSKDYRIIEVNKKCFRIQQKHTSPWRNPAEWWEYCYESTGETEEVLDKQEVYLQTQHTGLLTRED